LNESTELIVIMVNKSSHYKVVSIGVLRDHGPKSQRAKENLFSIFVPS
jgi:hypothetical protein